MRLLKGIAIIITFIACLPFMALGFVVRAIIDSYLVGAECFDKLMKGSEDE